MLKISQKLEYAIRAMIELAVRRPSGELVPAREIAAAQQIPLRFLEQQLGALGRAGLVAREREGALYRPRSEGRIYGCGNGKAR